jgi:translation initiation factor IF-1
MVKNTTGGKGSKSLARKLTSGSASSHFPVPSNELESFALVTKMHGPSCDVLFPDGSKLLCHIRNKFRGRSKRQNVIVIGNVVLIGLRDWESVRKNCDLMYVYDSGEISKIHDPALDYFNKYLYDTNIVDKYAAAANFTFEENDGLVEGGGSGDDGVGDHDVVQDNIDFDDI